MLRYSLPLGILFLSCFLGCFCSKFTLLLLGFLGFLFLNRRNLLLICVTLPRDLPFVLRGIYSLFQLKKWDYLNKNFIDLFEQNVRANPEKICFYFDNETWTFSDVDNISNKIARIFKAKGYKTKDVVALQMGNCPLYIAIWLGLAKIGVITALINTKLRGSGLSHCIKASKAQSVIFTEDFRSGITAFNLEDVDPIQIDSEAWKNLIKDTSSEPLPKESEKSGFSDPILYIYTSGTTGLPKAAIITHSKCILLCETTYYTLNLNQNDILYNPLPLYHTSGGLLGIAPTLVHGCSAVLRKSFSASNYIADCVQHNATIGFYIGEMCRYILDALKNDNVGNHKIRCMIGNGMKPHIWREFVEKFKIPRVIEFYGSTEGNANMVNVDGKIGAVGFFPQFLPRSLLPLDLIRVDNQGEPIRGPNGLCIRCPIGEPGMLVGIIHKKIVMQNFHGYVGGERENKSKILENVFRRGDQVFLTGDILVSDEYGYMYFKDRLGDTFRWKGENVSTDEIEAVAHRALGSVPICAYGVEVPNCEGRAGMLAIKEDSVIDLNLLFKEFEEHLPPYARPIFLRVAGEMPITGTFKIKKADLQKEGFNIKLIHDPLFFRKGSSYVPLIKDLYDQINQGIIKL